ncbi:MAG: aldo/keto reductase [Candidatus Kapaibacterium sp.]
MSKISKNKDLVLNNGVEIPFVGLGTYQMRGYEVEKAVEVALEAGYRHFDTAAIYGNEKEIGDTLRNLGVKRENIFITSKVWNDDQGFENTMNAIDISLDKLQTDFVDLYLVHWPLPDKRKSTWEAMIDIYDGRKARSIGVSNYTSDHIEELMKYSSITPVVNQIEITPFLYQKDLVSNCESFDIKIEAYSPLLKGKKLDDPNIVEIGKKYNKSSAQVLIRWSLEKGFIVLPKSANPDRIKENIDVFDFELSPEDMSLLDSLDSNIRISWDPSELD